MSQTPTGSGRVQIAVGFEFAVALTYAGKILAWRKKEGRSPEPLPDEASLIGRLGFCTVWLFAPMALILLGGVRFG